MLERKAHAIASSEDGEDGVPTDRREDALAVPSPFEQASGRSPAARELGAS